MERKANILIASRLRWPSVALFAGGLAAAGANVDVISPPGHPLRHLHGLRRSRYSLTRPLKSLREAIVRSAPDLIIPCDDIVVEHLIALRNEASAREPKDERFLAITDGAMSPNESCQTFLSRAGLISLAREAGVRAPLTETIDSADQAVEWLARHGGPAFMKLDGSCGGHGAREVRSPEEARAAFADLKTGPSLLAAAKEIAIEQVFSKAKHRLGLVEPIVSIQKAVPGEQANCSFACWKGEVLSVIAVKVLQTERPLGIATHVKVVESEAMRQTAARLARRLNLSGVFGLDFILDQATGEPWLIELNARPTQVSHFRLGAATDTIGELIQAISGERPVFHQSPFGDAKVALFPHQLRSKRRAPPDFDFVDDLPFAHPKLLAAYMPVTARTNRLIGAAWRRLGDGADRLLGTAAVRARR